MTCMQRIVHVRMFMYPFNPQLESAVQGAAHDSSKNIEALNLCGTTSTFSKMEEYLEDIKVHCTSTSLVRRTEKYLEVFDVNPHCTSMTCTHVMNMLYSWKI